MEQHWMSICPVQGFRRSIAMTLDINHPTVAMACVQSVSRLFLPSHHALANALCPVLPCKRYVLPFGHLESRYRTRFCGAFKVATRARGTTTLKEIVIKTYYIILFDMGFAFECLSFLCLKELPIAALGRTSAVPPKLATVHGHWQITATTNKSKTQRLG